MEASTSQMLNFEPPPIFCNSCLGSTDPEYLTYNLAVSGVLLAIVGMIGLIGNILVVKTYLHPELAIHSTSIYLAALGFSDFFLVLTAMFLFVLEAWRHHDYPTLAYLYVIGAPIVFPVAAVFQTSSVYFCVAAAVDCFIVVVLPESVKVLYCTPRRAKMTCLILFVICCAYNVPHFFELEKVDCLDDNGLDSMQICPTDIRLDAAYYAIYYTYMYTTFLAIGPLSLLILLNVCVVFTVVTKGSNEENGEDDTISLILVVFFLHFLQFHSAYGQFYGDHFRRPHNARLFCGSVEFVGGGEWDGEFLLLFHFWDQFPEYVEKDHPWCSSKTFSCAMDQRPGEQNQQTSLI